MSNSVFIADFAKSERQRTSEGYLVAPAKIARTGVQHYRAGELGLDGDQDRVIRLYRPEAEVFRAETLKSFEQAPLVINHPQEGVSAENWRNVAVGEVTNAQRFGDFIKARLTIKDAAAIKAIEDGLNQVSCGYTFDLDLTAGTSPSGESYDGVQRGIVANHVALVDSARGGPDLKIADSAFTAADSKIMCARDRWIANQQAGVPVEDDAPVEATEEQAPVMDARDAWIAKQSCDPAMAPTPQTRGGRDGWIDRQVQRSGFFRQPAKVPPRRNF